MHCNNHFLLLLLVFLSLPIQLPLAARQPDFSLEHLSSPFFHNNNSQDKTFEFEIEASGETYLMSVELSMSKGGKPTKTLAIADTGSDLIWLNSKKCEGDACHCEGEKTAAHCIEESISKTEDKCSGWSEQLEKLRQKCKYETCQCSPDDSSSSSSSCPYKTCYADGTSTEGELTNRKFLFNITNSIDEGKEQKRIRIWFGVSTKCNGKMNKNSTGIVGLGRGELSLMWQLTREAPFRFSYCLIPPFANNNIYYSPTKLSHKSKLRIGNQVTISEKYTPLLKNDEVYHCKNRYCVTLKHISVNEEGSTPHDIEVSEKNMVMMIDTGTTNTFLVEELYEVFISKVRNVVGNEEDPTKVGCFKKENVTKLKSVSLKFERGMTVELKRVNIFNESLCLTVKKETKMLKLNVLGSWAQTNFKVAISIEGDEGKASFDERDCATADNEEALDFQE